uniref:Reverse transcriptase n=1 Tax=Heterorhabditis bacteriophora TaxID=37862 RepID=A0A1I7X9V0_HETBA
MIDIYYSITPITSPSDLLRLAPSTPLLSNPDSALYPALFNCEESVIKIIRKLLPVANTGFIQSRNFIKIKVKLSRLHTISGSLCIDQAINLQKNTLLTIKNQISEAVENLWMFSKKLISYWVADQFLITALSSYFVFYCYCTSICVFLSLNNAKIWEVCYHFETIRSGCLE